MNRQACAFPLGVEIMARSDFVPESRGLVDKAHAHSALSLGDPPEFGRKRTDAKVAGVDDVAKSGFLLGS